jgi:hypothetical protein
VPPPKQSYEDALADYLLSSGAEACSLLTNRLAMFKLSNSLLAKRKIMPKDTGASWNSHNIQK